MKWSWRGKEGGGGVGEGGGRGRRARGKRQEPRGKGLPALVNERDGVSLSYHHVYHCMTLTLTSPLHCGFWASGTTTSRCPTVPLVLAGEDEDSLEVGEEAGGEDS